MIVICEPSCKSFSHEKINEGFIYIINKLHSDDILFLAHKTHWAVLKKSLLKNKVDISRINFVNISVDTNGSFDLLYSLKNIFKLKRISKKYNLEKIIFLSSSISDIIFLYSRSGLGSHCHRPATSNAGN